MEENLKHRIKMESLVGDISKHLISLPPDEIDRGIAYALQMAGEFVGVERSYIFQFVQGIVNQSGGNIKVYSKPNQGTTFEIHFPM